MPESKYTSSPICPHCDKEVRDAWEIDFGAGMEGDAVIECGNCGNSFTCSRMVEVYYSTSVIAEVSE